MTNKITVSTKKQGKIILDDSHYLASGGEGAVYAKGNQAFKIYHDTSKMLPIIKIQELSVLKDISCIVIPDEVIYDNKGLPIGYTMQYMKDSEHFCKLFTKSYKTANNISINDIGSLVDTLQQIMIKIHTRGIIVGDYNEMNFLMDKSIKIPYHIDVDSWQTPSYKCTAIMETVQDLTTKIGHFDEMTDWYSWAIITFQLFIGIHPYKGKHPNYKPRDFKQRVLDKVSVFNKDVAIPAMCYDFGTIPTKLKDWYFNVFEKGDRSVPPSISGVTLFIPVPTKTVNGSGAFIVTDYLLAQDIIMRVFNFKEVLYVVYKDNYVEFGKTSQVYSKDIYGLCEVLNDVPVIVKKDQTYAYFYDKDEFISKIYCDGGFFANGAFYSISNGVMTESKAIKMRKTIIISTKLDSVNLSNSVFDGFVSYDMVGRMNIVIPYKLGESRTYRLTELDGYTIVNGKYENRTCIIVATKSGKYDKFILHFDKNYNTFSCKKIEDIDNYDVNFTVLPNGIVTNIIGDETMELFIDPNAQVKEITNPPCNSSNVLTNHFGKVLYMDGNKLKKCTLK